MFVAVVPVKPPAWGKSRLVGLDHEARRGLASAFALDTVAACVGCHGLQEVLVATDDAAFSRHLTSLGAHTIPDGVAMDLNQTLLQSAAEARRRWPALVPVALTADLPAVRPADLDAVLDDLEPGEAAYVADASGQGTTLYTASHDEFTPHFGPDSARTHLRIGARAMGAPERLRLDVDDLGDLRAALRLGVGPRTAERAASLWGDGPLG